MASCLRGFQSWRLRMRGSLPVLKSGLVICTLFALDIRDAVYKVLWIGPSDSFYFRADSTVVLQSESLVSAMTAFDNSSLVLPLAGRRSSRGATASRPSAATSARSSSVRS